MQPNITSWGGGIVNGTNSTYHLFVTELTGGKGLSHWASNSQIVHAVASSPAGPYTRKDVIRGPSSSNPHIIFDERRSQYLLFYITGAGQQGNVGDTPLVMQQDEPAPNGNGILVSKSPDGPWINHGFVGCNNPTGSFHPNGTLFVLCHNGALMMTHTDSLDGPWAPLRDISTPHPVQ